MNDELAVPLVGLAEPVATPLIPWRESHDLLLDRFDCRHLLDSLPRRRTADDAVEPPHVAAVLDRVRRDADDDHSGNTTDAIEPANDRKRAAIPFEYTHKEAKKATPVPATPEQQAEYNAECERVPAGVVVPTDAVRRAVIAKTVEFVRAQGDRAEIALKLRGESAKLSFLLHTDPDFAYYAFCKRNGVLSARVRMVLERTVAHAAKLDHERAEAFIATLALQKASESDFAFLRADDVLHAHFRARLETARQAAGGSASKS